MLYHFVPFCTVLCCFFCNKAESPGGFSPDGGRFQPRAKPNLRPKPLSDTFQKKEMSQDRLKAFKGALLQAFKTKHSQSVAVAELLGLVNKDPTPA
ncbi:maternal DNA replication licensing factor mcm3-like [Gadus morhua]|uniref:maternal DNA replication licensing factor mcm3-like n=1 Tax=Gadus morhua TaxID=8049 RepID=UPI0011B851BC|nr:maternal DNA replication licensing factor mcm3-like [Gadus morhua]